MLRRRNNKREHGVYRPPPEQATGPSLKYMAYIHETQSMYDELEEWQAELAAEYGMKKTLEALRLGQGVEKTREYMIVHYGPAIKRRR
jgi:hypothetical protein